MRHWILVASCSFLFSACAQKTIDKQDTFPETRRPNSKKAQGKGDNSDPSQTVHEPSTEDGEHKQDTSSEPQAPTNDEAKEKDKSAESSPPPEPPPTAENKRSEVKKEVSPTPRVPSHPSTTEISPAWDLVISEFEDMCTEGALEHPNIRDVFEEIQRKSAEIRSVLHAIPDREAFKTHEADLLRQLTAWRKTFLEGLRTIVELEPHAPHEGKELRQISRDLAEFAHRLNGATRNHPYTPDPKCHEDDTAREGQVRAQISGTPSAYDAMLRDIAPRLANACQRAVLAHLMTKQGRLPWSDATYSNILKIHNHQQRDAYVYVIDHTGKLNWGDHVFINAARIQTNGQLESFKMLIDKAKYYDFQPLTYEVAVSIDLPSQLRAFEDVLKHTGTLNWKDAVYQAILDFANRPRDDMGNPKSSGKKPAEVERLFAKLIAKARYVDWPASAYEKLILVSDRKKAIAYDYVIETFPVQTILTTNKIQTLIWQNFLYTNLISIMELVPAAFNMDYVKALRKLLANRGDLLKNLDPSSISSSAIGLLAAGKVVKEAWVLVSALTYRQLAEGVFVEASRAVSTASSTISPLVVVVPLAIGLSADHFAAYMGGHTGADIIFNAAARIANDKQLDTFRKLISRVKWYDWPAQAYIAMEMISTHEQKRRIDFLIDRTKAIRYNEAVFSLAVSAVMTKHDREELTEFDGIKMSHAEVIYRKMINAASGRISDWSQEAYESIANVSNMHQRAIYEQAIEAGKLSFTESPLWHPPVQSALVHVNSEFAARALIALLSSGREFDPKAYLDATKLQGETALAQFLNTNLLAGTSSAPCSGNFSTNIQTLVAHYEDLAGHKISPDVRHYANLVASKDACRAYQTVLELSRTWKSQPPTALLGQALKAVGSAPEILAALGHRPDWQEFFSESMLPLLNGEFADRHGAMLELLHFERDYDLRWPVKAYEEVLRISHKFGSAAVEALGRAAALTPDLIQRISLQDLANLDTIDEFNAFVENLKKVESEIVGQ